MKFCSIRSSAPVRCLFHVALLLTIFCFAAARGELPEDKYLRIHSMIQQGETFASKNQDAQALAKYKEAQIALRDFQLMHPDWNVKVVSFRSKWLAQQVATLTQKLAPKPAEEPANTNASEAGSPAPGSAAATAGKDEIKLLEPGAEPRKEMRLHPAAGSKQTLAFNMNIGLTVKAGEMEQPEMKIPEMKLTLDVTVKDVAANGDISYEIVVTDATVAEGAEAVPGMMEAMKAAMANFKGLSGTGKISNRGMGKGTDIKAPPNADPQMRQTVAQFKEMISRIAMQLPAEPIGKGAKWEVKMPIETQGIKMQQIATFELTNIEGERLATKAAVTQRAGNQKIPNPIMPGTTTDLTKMTGTGTTEAIYDLVQVVPQTAKVDMNSESDMVMSLGGQKQPMTMKQNLKLTMEAK